MKGETFLYNILENILFYVMNFGWRKDEFQFLFLHRSLTLYILSIKVSIIYHEILEL